MAGEDGAAGIAMRRVLSLGAGVQSTVILLMSCIGELERIDFAVFADTGWEPQAVYDHLAWLEGFAESSGIFIARVSCGRNIRTDAVAATVRGLKKDGQCHANMPFYTANQDGTKGMIRRQCTREYKIDPIRKYLRSVVTPPRRKPSPPLPLIEQWFGISMDEIQRMRLSKEWWIVNHYPLVELGMTRDDCLQWLDRHGFKRPVRSACIACPFKSDSEWRWLKDNHPAEFEDACKFDEAVRDRGGMRG